MRLGGPTAPSRRARPQLRRSEASSGLRVAGLLVAVGFAFPGVYLVYRNFAEGADPAGLLLSDRTLGPLWRSLKLAVSVSGAALVLGTVAGVVYHPHRPAAGSPSVAGVASVAPGLPHIRRSGCVHPTPSTRAGWPTTCSAANR